MHTTLIIPAFNEEECIGRLLQEVNQGFVNQVIVVDNGSTDGTGQVARDAGAIVIEEAQRGYGHACLAGALAADGDVLAFMDGDGSFSPADLPKLLALLERNDADLVLGTRMHVKLTPGVMPPHQKFGNRLVAMLLSMLYGLRLTDLGPYRVIRRELLFSLDMQELTYGWPVEMMVKVAREKKTIAEVPVSYRPRFGGQSKVSGTLRGTIMTAFRIFIVIVRYAI